MTHRTITGTTITRTDSTPFIVEVTPAGVKHRAPRGGEWMKLTLAEADALWTMRRSAA